MKPEAKAKKTTLKNNEERLKYLKDINNWEELGTWDILKEKDGNPLFKLLRLKGAGIYCLLTYTKEISLDWWIEGWPHEWKAGYRGGYLFVLDRDGRFDKPLNVKDAINRLREIGLISVEERKQEK